jgi:Rrf2 family protein
MLGEGAQITAEEVSRKRLLPRAFVRRIIRRLGSAGILRTIRGAGGGIALSRPASQISLLDVIRAVEGGFTLNPCVDNPLACPLTKSCPVRTSWASVTDQTAAALGAIRFDYLAKASGVSRRRISLNKPAGQPEKRKKGEGRGRA